MNEKLFKFDCDSRGGILQIRTDSQGDIYLTVKGDKPSISHTARLCGPGGGSNYPGLGKAVLDAVEKWVMENKS